MTEASADSAFERSEQMRQREAARAAWRQAQTRPAATGPHGRLTVVEAAARKAQAGRLAAGGETSAATAVAPRAATDPAVFLRAARFGFVGAVVLVLALLWLRQSRKRRP